MTKLHRQEAQERSRRQEQDLAIGKADYDKLIDKKQCPSCGAKQSYDEVKEKRKGQRGLLLISSCICRYLLIIYICVFVCVCVYLHVCLYVCLNVCVYLFFRVLFRITVIFISLSNRKS